MTRDFNLPPGCSGNDFDGEPDIELLQDLEAEESDAWRDQAVDREREQLETL